MALLGTDGKELDRTIEICRMFVTVCVKRELSKDLFEGICEAGVALVKDGGVSGRDLEAAMSRALADLL